MERAQAPFPLTPTLAPKERESYRLRGDKSRQTSRATHDRAPSPLGRRRCEARLSPIGRTRKLIARPPWLPLLWGAGWGEGERGRRTDAAAQDVFGPRETEPQFLAASDIQTCIVKRLSYAELRDKIRILKKYWPDYEAETAPES